MIDDDDDAACCSPLRTCLHACSATFSVPVLSSVQTIHRTLRTYTKANKLLPIMYTKVYMYQIARSLSYIHSLGVCVSHTRSSSSTAVVPDALIFRVTQPSRSAGRPAAIGSACRNECQQSLHVTAFLSFTHRRRICTCHARLSPRTSPRRCLLDDALITHSARHQHRDIKPQNLLLDTRTHKVLLCDFGRSAPSRRHTHPHTASRACVHRHVCGWTQSGRVGAMCNYEAASIGVPCPAAPRL